MGDPKTAFDRFLDEQMADPAFANEYEQARREIASADALIAALDAARVELGMSKAELARRVALQPAAVRRLFSAEQPNPTFATLVSLADAVGFKLQLVPKDHEDAAE